MSVYDLKLLNYLYNFVCAHDGEMYVVGSYALREYSDGDWIPNDIDVIVTNIFHDIIKNWLQTNVSHLLKHRPSAQNIKAHIGCVQTEGEPPLDIISLFDCQNVPNYMDNNFDLNICCIGYQLIPYNLPESAFELLKVINRLYPYISKNIRKMIVSYINPTTFAKKWIYGESFDPEAANQKRYAILQWERDFSSNNMTISDRVQRGYSRSVKYTRRGYCIAEYPSRFNNQELKNLIRAGHIKLAKDALKREKQNMKKRKLNNKLLLI